MYLNQQKNKIGLIAKKCTCKPKNLSWYFFRRCQHTSKLFLKLLICEHILNFFANLELLPWPLQFRCYNITISRKRFCNLVWVHEKKNFWDLTRHVERKHRLFQTVSCEWIVQSSSGDSFIWNTYFFCNWELISICQAIHKLFSDLCINDVRSDYAFIEPLIHIVAVKQGF